MIQIDWDYLNRHGTAADFEALFKELAAERNRLADLEVSLHMLRDLRKAQTGDR